MMEMEALALPGGRLFFEGCIIDGGRLLFDREAAPVFNRLFTGGDGMLPDGFYRYCLQKPEGLYFGSDHMGSRPLFYKTDDNTQVHTYLPKGGRLSDSGFTALLSCGFTLDDETLYADYRECEPGTVYFVPNGVKKAQKKVWFTLPVCGEGELTPRSSRELTVRLLPASSSGWLAALTGGLDTRCLAALAVAGGAAMQTYTIGEISQREVELAARVAAHLHVPWQRLEPEWSGPMLHNAPPFYGRALPHDLAWLAGQKFVGTKAVFLDGYGGDWSTGGTLDCRVTGWRDKGKVREHLLGVHCRLTGITLPAQRDLLAGRLELMLARWNDDPVALYEKWLFLHHERKYNANTLNLHAGLGQKAFLPFYTYNWLQWSFGLRRSQRYSNFAYYRWLREQVFVGDLAPLVSLPSTRSGLCGVLQTHPPRFGLAAALAASWHRHDPAGKRHAILPVNPGLRRMLDLLPLRENDPNMRVKKVLPALAGVAEELKPQAPVAAAHLQNVLNLRLRQLTVNGLILLVWLHGWADAQ